MRSPTVSTKLQELAKQARRYPDRVFTTLAHWMDVEFLREAYRRLNKRGAPGLDKVTAADYAKHLEENLIDLHERLRSGRYRAPLIKRVWIEKENGKQRPLGIPQFEDKIVQRAVEMLLSAIYEEMFHDFSHGFRKGRSQHKAIHELRESCIRLNIQRILIADITGLFDNIDHQKLLDFIRLRVNDGAILRLIGKWLKAGVMEDERVAYPDKGTPQGGVISPLLSNIFLHYALDDWFANEANPRLIGNCFVIRWADDFIIGFQNESDAGRVKAVLPRRFNRFGLELHPDKTTLIHFGRPRMGKSDTQGSDTFDFLGFTFYWAKSRMGYPIIKKKTARKRLNRYLKMTWNWCKENRHDPIQDQYQALSAKLRGFYQYYGVRSNFKALEAAYEYTEKAWRRWLSRRSHKGKVLFEELRDAFPLPKPRIVHAI